MPRSLFLSGGIGDCFALDSHLDLRAERIFWGTPRHATLIELFHDKAEEHITLWSDLFRFGCFASKQHCLNTWAYRGWSVPDGLEQAEDFSIVKIFGKIEKGELPFRGSGIIERFRPPTICADKIFVHSLTVRPPTFGQWEETLAELEERNQTAYCVGPCPDHARITPHQGSIGAAIRELCGSGGYIGINSCFSVLAAQLFPASRIKIYGGTDWPAVYYAPHKSFEFIRDATIY